MRLLSAKVRSYRVHRETAVEFDPARTLIGGPNESGKSTLIEAIHRGLFLKATVVGEAHERMRSTVSTGQPEVEVRFEARGAQYELAKRFSGQSGTTRLVQVGGHTWLGEEAQTRLAELLGVVDVGGGRGVDERVAEQWSHLWVWQGRSLDDPCGHVAAQQADLLQQLQQAGGAVAMQSELDGRVAARFSRAKSLIFTSAGVKKNSDLERAQTALAEAQAELLAAADRVERLGRAAEEFEEASAAIERSSKEWEKLSADLQQVEAKLGRVEQLRRLEEKQSVDLDGALKRLASLEAVEKDIEDLRESIAGLRRSLAPREGTLARLASELAGVREQKDRAEAGYERALEATREAWRGKELAAAYLILFDKRARCEKLDGYVDRVRGIENELTGIRGDLARLVPLDQQGLGVLQDLESRAAQASSAVRGMATEVEVVAAETPVQVGTVQLRTGDRHTVSDLTDVVVGEVARLRIHPGGGDSLADARERERTLREELRRMLDGYGLGSVAQAAEMTAERSALLAKERTAADRLREWPGGLAGLLEERKVAEQDLAAAAAEVQRRAEQVADVTLPATAEDARARLLRAEEKLRRAESGEGGSRAELDGLRRLVEDKETAFAEARGSIDDDKSRLARFSSQLELLTCNYGADELRAGMLEEAHRGVVESETALAGTRAALDQLQAEMLEADRARLQRALDQTADLKLDAQTRWAASRAILRSDGADDPGAILAQADARVQAATADLEAVERKAKAIALIDGLFLDEQRSLADRFSRPLAEKISAYLRYLFGPDANVVVSFRDDRFKSIELVRSRDGGTVSFARLSGGTREQVSAAVRLAIAELLAASHDGSLPVVFDDAFAYSDPERVNTLQRMLDLGAAHGLQIIVLTCNPSDYAALGARQVLLR